MLYLSTTVISAYSKTSSQSLKMLSTMETSNLIMSSIGVKEHDLVLRNTI